MVCRSKSVKLKVLNDTFSCLLSNYKTLNMDSSTAANDGQRDLIQQVMGPQRWQALQSRPTIPKLLGRRFHLWKYRMTTLFKESDLWPLVSGLIPSPEEGAEENAKAAWTKLNELAMRYILEALEDDQLVRIMHMEEASQMWSKLIQVNESTTGARKTALINEATNLKMKTGESAKEYVTRFSEIVIQLQMMKAAVDDDIQKAWLLRGLPKGYEMLKVALQNRGTPPDVEETMRAIEDHYETRETDQYKGKSEGTEDQAMAALKKKYRSDQKDILERTTCHKCHKKGHWKANCPDKASKATEGKDPENWYDFDDHEEATTEHHAKVTRLKGSSVTYHSAMRTEEQNVWYVDSAASLHMTPHVKLLSNYKDSAKQKSIYLADDKVIKTQGYGDISFEVEVEGRKRIFKVERGYYVPDLAANLISVGALTEDGTQTVSFHQKGCDIRATGGHLYAQGDREGNMFKIKGEAKTGKAFSASDSPAYLWHKRLGHIGGQSMKVLLRSREAAGAVHRC